MGWRGVALAELKGNAAMQTFDPTTGTVVESDGTNVVMDPSSPTGTRLLTQHEIGVAAQRQQLVRTLAVGGLVVGAVAGYRWQGWKGAVGIPVAAAIVYLLVG